MLMLRTGNDRRDITNPNVTQPSTPVSPICPPPSMLFVQRPLLHPRPPTRMHSPVLLGGFLCLILLALLLIFYPLLAIDIELLVLLLDLVHPVCRLAASSGAVVVLVICFGNRAWGIYGGYGCRREVRLFWCEGEGEWGEGGEQGGREHTSSRH